MNYENEKELIKQAIDGDRKAFNTIVNKYKKRVFYTAMKMVRNKDDAYDITQDVFISAYKNLGTFKGDSSLFTWLYRITVNKSIKFTTRDKYRNMLPVNEIGNDEKSKLRPDMDYRQKQLQNRLDSAVIELPPQQRAVFTMRFYDGMPHNEIARILNRSEGATKANYFQAIRKLRESLSDLFPINANSSITDEVQK